MRLIMPPGQPATEATAREAAQAARNAADAQANADKMIEDAIKSAERATEASQPPLPSIPDGPESPANGPIVFSTEDGEPVSVSFKDGTLTLSQEGNTQAIALRDAIPREAVQIAWAIPATLSVLLIWWPISRAVIRWLNRKHVANTEAAALEARLRDRFETLERNLDTVAVEMERLSEGQRFTNKLLAERGEQVPVNVQR